MTDVAGGSAVLPPPEVRNTLSGRIRRTFFSSPLNTGITLAVLAFLAWALPPMLQWAVLDATWTGTAQDCRAAGGGACWAFVNEKLRFMIFGFYPPAEHWRPTAMMALFIAMIVLSAWKASWRAELFPAWAVTLLVMFFLLTGGDRGMAATASVMAVGFALWELRAGYLRGNLAHAGLAAAVAVAVPTLVNGLGLHWFAVLAFAGLAAAAARRQGLALPAVMLWAWATFGVAFLSVGSTAGLSYLPTTQWSGLPLTMGLSVIGLVVAFPISIGLALGRRSNMPVLRVMCVTYIELIRGVPLITILFMAAFLFPLLLAEGMTIDKLLRVQVALIMFAAAYMAEIVRGGLQAMPRGQYEAADALGLTYWQKMGKIILPQALKITIPSMVNTAIGFFKDTSLVLIIGLFDFLQAARSSMTDSAWLGFSTEGYVFAALVYFVFCFGMSRYSLKLEHDLSPERRR
jgi:general L-amino acid transport system permease protein